MMVLLVQRVARANAILWRIELLYVEGQAVRLQRNTSYPRRVGLKQVLCEHDLVTKFENLLLINPAHQDTQTTGHHPPI